LLAGTQSTSLPPCRHGQVSSDFRMPAACFPTMLNLLLTLFAIKPQEPVAVDLRESLSGRMR
jgi:hypothetical protein